MHDSEDIPGFKDRKINHSAIIVLEYIKHCAENDGVPILSQIETELNYIISATEAPRFNPNEAPEGYVAKLIFKDESVTNLCEGCAFVGKAMCHAVNCTSDERKDRHDVIFVKKG